MRLPRFTVRRLMVVVAMAGLALGIEVTRRRRDTFLEMARVFDNTATVLRAEDNGTDDPGPHGPFPSSRRLADHCEAMRQKYEKAARRPWLPVEPDPPLPDGNSDAAKTHFDALKTFVHGI